ncbi:hypothetical protein BS78_05G194200 [Paspalum vaginatum]|nr:hypothetical protein BS78_05G194200 [Paspalum vaginatum]
MHDEREEEFMASIIREGTEEISAQEHEEADSYVNYENAEADSDREDNADHSNKNPLGSSQKENFEERYTITHVGDYGQPLEPVKAATKFVNYCGIIVRENVPISIPAWKKAEKKELLWRELSNKFTLPEGTEEMVKQWALKKMAILLQTFKTKVWGNYVKHGQPPDFGKYLKLRGDWELFVQYKESEAAIARSEQNSESSRKTKWNQSSNNEGSTSKGAERLVEAIDKSSKGKFIPEREKDELTWALENREHPGRTRGLGNVSWKVGFPEDRGSYRKRRTLSEADAKINPRPAEDEKRYPVDDLKHHCSCELHIPTWNLSTAVAHSVALPVVPGQKFHCSGIPPGYSTVIVEQVVSGYEDLELQQKGGDGERTLKEVVHGMILWLKAYIELVPENRDGGTTAAQSTATAGGGSRTESARHRSPNNDPPPRPSPSPPQSHANDPPPSPSPPLTKNSKSSKTPKQQEIDPKAKKRQILNLKGKILPSERIRAVQEQLTGFILDSIVSETGEFYRAPDEYHLEF